ncbi:hypothetical protein ACFLQ9_00490 [Bacteroidota bacterium]
MKETFLNIADYEIRVYTIDKSFSILLNENYSPFLTDKTKTPDVSIELICGIPDSFIKTTEIYKAKIDADENNSEYFWSINEMHDERILFTSNEGNDIFPFFALCFSNENRNWRLHFSKKYLKTRKSIDPFTYPLGPLILYYLTAFSNSIMIHGSGIRYNSEGYLFSGVSGVGKSTMAELWYTGGAQIINDDRLIIREINDRFYIYNTPMYYIDHPKKSSLDKIFLIKHGKTNISVKLNAIKAITMTMANCIHHSYNREIVATLIESIGRLSEKIPIYELDFVPDQSIVNFIKSL